MLSQHYSRQLPEQELQELFDGCFINSVLEIPFNNMKEKRLAFDKVTSYLEKQYNIKIERDIAAQYRVKALEATDYPLIGKPQPKPPSISLIANKQHDKRYVDAEFVAIYW